MQKKKGVYAGQERKWGTVSGREQNGQWPRSAGMSRSGLARCLQVRSVARVG
jgi:hypothetical protein